MSFISSQVTQVSFLTCICEATADLLIILNSIRGGFDCFLHVVDLKMTELFGEKTFNGRCWESWAFHKTQVKLESESPKFSVLIFS